MDVSHFAFRGRDLPMLTLATGHDSRIKGQALNRDKLSKVMKLMHSDREGEAVAAFWAARQLLGNLGMTFGDLVALDGAAGSLLKHMPDGPAAKQWLVHAWREQLAKLDEQKSQAQNQLVLAEADAKRWRQHAESLEVTLAKTLAESERWRRLAKQTAEQLWDMGKVMEQNRISSGLAEKREAVLGYLKDPSRAHWSDREIARRVGVSPQTVANWRNRLAKYQGAPEKKPLERIVRRGAVTYKMQVATIGRKRASDEE